MRRRQGQPQRPLFRRDADGGARTAPSWETLTERLIREAQEEGRFADLPGHGQPLDLTDDSLAGDKALAHHLLRNAGVAPPWIETDKDARAALVAIDGLLARAARSGPFAAGRLRDELEALADRHDDAARRLESLAPSPRQHRPPLDRVRLRRRLEEALDHGGVAVAQNRPRSDDERA